MLKNLYLVPFLLGIDISRLDIWHGINTAEPDYIEYMPEEYLNLWDDEALAWADSVYENAQVQQILEKCINIRSKLNHEPPGSIRNQLVDEEQRLKDSDLAD